MVPVLIPRPTKRLNSGLRDLQEGTFKGGKCPWGGWLSGLGGGGGKPGGKEAETTREPSLTARL